MTGCFGAVDNADAEQNDSDTIVNNYYYNNTTTTIMQETEYFTNGGMIDSNTPYAPAYNSNSLFTTLWEQQFYPYNFTSNAGEAVKINYFNGQSSLSIDTECSDSSTFFYNQVGTGQDNFLGGAHANCTHSVVMTITDYGYDNTTSTIVDYSNAPYSLIYSIESVTVV